MHFIEKYQNPVAARNNPRQLFGIFTISIVVLAFFLATLQQIGTPLNYLIYLGLGLLALVYPVVGFLSRSMKFEDYHLAGKRGHTLFNGMAIAGGALSGTAYILLSGAIYNSGYSALFLISGLFLGMALASLFFADAISKQAAFTVPQFIVSPDQQPGYGKLLKFLLVIVLVSISTALVIAQLTIIREIAGAFFNLSEPMVIYGGTLAVLTCLIPGGLRGLTWARIGLYTVAALAFLGPIIWLATSRTNIPIPQLAYGTGALDLLENFGNELRNQGFDASAALVSVTDNLLQLSLMEITILVLSTAAGTAAMPHLLQHFSTNKSYANARQSGNWALLFLIPVLTAAPAYAAFMKLEIFNLVVGLPVDELGDLVPWLFERGQFAGDPLVTICGKEATEIAAVVAQCSNGQPYVVAPEDFYLHESMIFMQASLIADLPSLFTVLIAVGAFAALFSTVDGLLLISANTISNDGFKALLRPACPDNTTLFLSRALLLAVALGSAYLSLQHTFSIPLLFSGAIGLAAAGLFPAMILRSVHPSISNLTLLTAVSAGCLVALAHAFSNLLGPDFVLQSGDEILWFSSDKMSLLPMLHSGFLGMIVALVTGTLLARGTRTQAKVELHAEN